jgi:hypothetical protein
MARVGVKVRRRSPSACSAVIVLATGVLGGLYSQHTRQGADGRHDRGSNPVAGDSNDEDSRRSA